MNSINTSLNRRRVIEVAGVSAASVVGFSHRTLAEESNENVTIEISSQISDGKSIVIDSLETDVDGLLQIFTYTDERPVYKSMQISAGTKFTDRTVKLDDPIPETRSIRVSLYPPEGGQAYDGMAVEVLVSEDIDGAEPVGTGYGTEPGVQKIEADTDAGFHSPYFLYTPTTHPSAIESVSNSGERPLLATAYPWGNFEERVEGANGRVEGGVMRKVADATNCPVLAAPLTLTQGYVGLEPQELTLAHEIDITDPRRERVDLQFIAMIKDAKSRLNSDTHTMADQIHYAGGSSAAYFIEKIAPLHPEYISVFSFGANGLAFLPFKELTDDIPVHGDPQRTTIPYPIGAANLEELTGEEFNKEAWMDIEQFRWIGAEDQDLENSEEYVHKRFKSDNEISRVVGEIFGKLQVSDRFETSQEIYDHLDVPATFTKFEGQPHSPDWESLQEVIEFHQQQINEDFELIHLIPQQPASEVNRGGTLPVSVTAENPTALESMTTISLAVDGTEVETTDIQVDPKTTETVELETTFEETGEFSLSVNETTVVEPVVVTEETTEVDEEEDTERNTEDSSAEADSGEDDSATDQDEVTAEEQPGFGIVHALTSMGGIGYIINRRLSKNN